MGLTTSVEAENNNNNNNQGKSNTTTSASFDSLSSVSSAAPTSELRTHHSHDNHINHNHRHDPHHHDFHPTANHHPNLMLLSLSSSSQKTKNTATTTKSENEKKLLTPYELRTLPIVSHFIYSCLCEYVYNDPGRRPLPPGWSILLDATDCHLDREGYFACAFINESLRSCVIAQRGTVTAEGLRTGIWVFFDEPTIQFHLAAQFSKLVRLRLQLKYPQWCVPEDDMVPPPVTAVAGAVGQEAEDAEQHSPANRNCITISYCGHSIGAVLAACRAVEEHTFAVTFESPGCKKFVEQTMHPFKADDCDIITYLRYPNPINCMKPHCGFLIQLPSESDHPNKITDIKKAASFGGVPLVKKSSSSSLPGDQKNINDITSDVIISKRQISSADAVAAVNARTANEFNQKQQQSAATASTTQNKNMMSNNQKTAEKAKQMTSSLLRRPFGIPLNLSSLWSAPHFLQNKLLESMLPEVQLYLTKLEPVIRELIDYTAQSHSISAICNVMEKGEITHQGQQVIVRWPENMLQFIEYYNIIRELNLLWEKDTISSQNVTSTNTSNKNDNNLNKNNNKNSNISSSASPQQKQQKQQQQVLLKPTLAHALAAYKTLLQKLWVTEYRPLSRLPLRFLNQESRLLLQILCNYFPPVAQSNVVLLNTNAVGNNNFNHFGFVPNNRNNNNDDDGNNNDSPQNANNISNQSNFDSGSNVTNQQQQQSASIYTSTPTTVSQQSANGKQDTPYLTTEEILLVIDKLPLSMKDRQVLSTIHVDGDSLISYELSAFEAKQYLAIVTQRASIRAALERFKMRMMSHQKSKL